MAQRREAGRHRRQHDVSLVEVGEISRIQVCVRKGASDLLVQNIHVGGRLLLRNAGLQTPHDEHGLIEVILVSVKARGHGLHHREGNPDVGRLTHLGAEELRRSDADDVEDGRAQLDLSVEHGRIAGEGTLPPRVADDRDGMIAFSVVILVSKRSAEHRLNAERRKICAGDKLHVHLLNVVTTVDCAVDTIAAC